MPNLDDVRHFLAEEHGLTVVSTTRSNGEVLSSVVNAGVIDDPITAAASLAFVSAGGAARLAHVRRGASVTATVRRGWRWVSVTGPARIVGPDDAADGIDGDRLRLLLREVFEAAGGTHDDYDEYDRVMREERRAAVFVEPVTIRGNG